MALHHLILYLLSKKANCDISTPHGANILRNDIEARTGEKLSINTIKRLVGVIRSDASPRMSTLDIIAKYLDYIDGKHLVYVHSRRITSRFLKEKPYIDLRDEPVGMEIDLRWSINHRMRIKHLGEGKYVVRASHNTKLQAGDILSMTLLARHYPLAISEVIRGEENLGNYIAGMDDGIEMISKRL
ncbi:MAG: hypothetical protein K2M69_06505 [Muribaculaceae bacterium]|nr:hypothetical protein [Muribaculaceae bacterium]